MKNIILTGDRPTGRLHLGHYVGSLKRRVELQNSGRFDEIKHPHRRRSGPDRQRRQPRQDPGEYHQRRAGLPLRGHRPHQVHHLRAVHPPGAPCPDLLLYESGHHGTSLPQPHGEVRDPDAGLCRRGACRWAFFAYPSLRPPISRPSTPTWCLWARISFPCWSRPVRSWRSSTASMARR